MTTQAIQAGRAGIEVFLDRSRLERDARAVRDRLGRMGRGIESIGTGLATAGLAAATPLGIAVGRFADFDQAMASVKAKLPGLTGDEFEQLRGRAADLGKSTSFTAREVAEAMDFLALAGFDAQQILDGIGPVLNLAKAGSMDLALASDIASDSLTGFGLTTRDFNRIVDVLAATSTSANASVLQLGETFKFAAPLASISGQRLETVAAAAGKMADGGVKATMAGTDLAVIMKQLADATVQEKLGELGVIALDSAGNIRSLTDIFEDLGPAIGDLPSGEKVGLLADMFGRATKSAGLLVKAASDPTPGKSLRDLEEALDSAAGTGQRMADIMGDTLRGEMTRTTSAADGLGNAVGRALEGDSRRALVAVGAMIGGLTEWVDQNQQLVSVIGQVAVGAVALGASLKGVGLVVRLLSKFVGRGGLIGALLTLGSIFGKFALEKFISHMGFATDKTKELNAALQDLKETAKDGAGGSGPGGRLESGLLASDRMPEDFNSLELNRIDRQAKQIADPDERAAFYGREAERVLKEGQSLRAGVLDDLASGRVRDRDTESYFGNLFGQRSIDVNAPELDRAGIEQQLFDAEQLAAALRSRANRFDGRFATDANPGAKDDPFADFDEQLKAIGSDFASEVEGGAKAAADQLGSKLPEAFELSALEVGTQSFDKFDQASRGLGESDEAKLQTEYMLGIKTSQEDAVKHLRTIVNRLELPTDGEVD